MKEDEWWKPAATKTDKWWASLTVPQKENIATSFANKSGDVGWVISYPACTAWWNGLMEADKQKVYEAYTLN